MQMRKGGSKIKHTTKIDSYPTLNKGEKQGSGQAVRLLLSHQHPIEAFEDFLQDTPILGAWYFC